ncbi:LysR substrate-binding domain-containing protein [Streptomyces sp. NPDC050636]|uniref:LysR family transcriptional regulator n=1 Tax=Streptomyces sp. NPDC050636 TaxID=3154510 RepID=UPI003449A37A
MEPFELRELRYFVAVAEELNFSRAAERLGMAQPPLSRAIRQLEKKLGLSLLERDTRSAALTPAGRVLLEQSRIILDAVFAAERRTRRAAQQDSRLRIALTPDADGGLLKDILHVYHADATLPRAEVLIASWGAPEAMLHDGRADVAIVRTPTGRQGVQLEPVITEPRVLVTSADHPLTRKGKLRLADLNGEVFPEWSGSDDLARAYWKGQDTIPPDVRRPERDGRPEQGPLIISDLHQLFTVVSLGQGIALLPRSIVRERAESGVFAVRPVEGVSPSTVYVAWSESSTSQAVAAFLTAAVSVGEDLTSL